MTTPGTASQWLASFHLPLGHILNPVRVIEIGPLTTNCDGPIWICGIHQPTLLPLQYPPYPVQYGAQIPPPMPQYPVQQQNQVLAVPEADDSDTESTGNSSEEGKDTSEPESADQEDFGQYVLSFN